MAMLDLLIVGILASVAGALTGLAAAYWFLMQRGLDENAAVQVEPADPFVSAEIDQAAVRWATEKGRPEAAGVMADKLHMLYGLARRRRPR
jgi:hypothetical protein